LKRERPKHFLVIAKEKGISFKKGAPWKRGQSQRIIYWKFEKAMFQCNGMGHDSKNCPKLKQGNFYSKVIFLFINLAWGENNHFIFLNCKITKHNFLICWTQEFHTPFLFKIRLNGLN
jgi:hypothetical protein